MPHISYLLRLLFTHTTPSRAFDTTMQKGEDLDFGTRPVYDAEDQRLQKQAQRQSSWLNVLRIISRILDLVSSYLPPHPSIPHSPSLSLRVF